MTQLALNMKHHVILKMIINIAPTKKEWRIGQATNLRQIANAITSKKRKNDASHQEDAKPSKRDLKTETAWVFTT